MDLGTIETVEWRRPSPASRILSQPGNGFALYGWLRDDTILFWSDPSFSSSFAADGLELDAISAGQRKARSLGHVRTLVYRDLLSLAPDGKSLLATLTTSGGRETWEDRPLAVIDLANGARRIVSPLRVSTLFPAWSPGGDYIAYVQAPVGTENKRRMKERKIWVMRRDGSERQQVTRDQAYRDEHPVWVSGDTILFCRIGAAYRASLWSISKSGANLTRIAGLPTLPDEAFGFYGYVDWGRYLDVWADGP
jgi:dipeptidyl aminopeptidase/acylaminoacyl peptidase